MALGNYVLKWYECGLEYVSSFWKQEDVFLSWKLKQGRHMLCPTTVCQHCSKKRHKLLAANKSSTHVQIYQWGHRGHVLCIFSCSSTDHDLLQHTPMEDWHFWPRYFKPPGYSPYFHHTTQASVPPGTGWRIKHIHFTSAIYCILPLYNPLWIH